MKLKIAYHTDAYIKVDEKTFEMCRNELPTFSEMPKQLAILYDSLQKFINNSEGLISFVEPDGTETKFYPEEAHYFILEHINEYDFILKDNKIFINFPTN